MGRKGKEKNATVNGRIKTRVGKEKTYEEEGWKGKAEQDML